MPELSMVRVRPEVLASIVRPVPVCKMDPALLIVDEPVTVMGTVLPASERAAPEETLPDSPAVSARAVLLVPLVMLNDVAWDAEPEIARRPAVRRQMEKDFVFTWRD